MPRQNDRQRTQREATAIGTAMGSRPVNLQPARRNLQAAGRGYTDPMRKANALVNAFGLAGDIYMDAGRKRIKKETIAGRQAALEGVELSPQEKRTRAFMSGYEEVVSDAEFAVFSEELMTEASQLDRASMSTEQYQSWVNDKIAEQYNFNPEDEMDLETMARLQPGIAKLETALLQEHQQATAQSVQDDLDSAFAVRNEVMAKNGNLIENIESIQSLYFNTYQDPRVANEEMMNDLGLLAVRLGKPEIVEAMLERKHWANGAAAPGGLDDMQQQLISYLQSARGAKQYQEREAEKNDEENHKEWMQQEGNEIMIMATVDNDPTSALVAIKKFMQDGGDWEEATRLRNAIQSYQTLAVGTQAPSYENMYDLELKIAQGTATMEDITAAANAGDFGSGKVGQSNLRAAMAALRSAENFERQNPLHKSKMAEFTAQYGSDLRYRQALPQVDQYAAEATRKVYELMQGDENTPGLSVDQATKKVLEELPPKSNEHWGNVYSNISGGSVAVIDDWKLATGSTSAKDVMDSRDTNVYPNQIDYFNALAPTLTSGELKRLANELGIEVK